ncbi:MAG: hypothetical protein WC934_02895 [Acidithiobacillus sp.]|jgi:hypothetical protein|uniref:hypothetical protein n=1 Tax=Acidithiobacillus sp. TaxID=1872118 RepID=UPI00355EDAC3
MESFSFQQLHVDILNLMEKLPSNRLVRNVDTCQQLNVRRSTLYHYLADLFYFGLILYKPSKKNNTDNTRGRPVNYWVLNTPVYEQYKEQGLFVINEKKSNIHVELQKIIPLFQLDRNNYELTVY